MKHWIFFYFLTWVSSGKNCCCLKIVKVSFSKIHRFCNNWRIVILHRLSPKTISGDMMVKWIEQQHIHGMLLVLVQNRVSSREAYSRKPSESGARDNKKKDLYPLLRNISFQVQWAPIWTPFCSTMQQFLSQLFFFLRGSIFFLVWRKSSKFLVFHICQDGSKWFKYCLRATHFHKEPFNAPWTTFPARTCNVISIYSCEFVEYFLLYTSL